MQTQQEDAITWPMNDPEFDALYFFVGGFPPRFWFDSCIQELATIIRSHKSAMCNEENRMSVAYEVCLISLASYFEAFCKIQFGSLINICPQLLKHFSDKRPDLSISLKHLIRLEGRIDNRLGALLAEECDFGSSKAINSLFFDLLRITPLSKNEQIQYNEFLRDRNLIVHHAGVYTIKYLGQKLQQNTDAISHWDSLVVGEQDFSKWMSLMRSLADKIATDSHKALDEYIKKEGIKLTRKHRKAMKYLLWKM